MELQDFGRTRLTKRLRQGYRIALTKRWRNPDQRRHILPPAGSGRAGDVTSRPADTHHDHPAVTTTNQVASRRGQGLLNCLLYTSDAADDY